MEKKKVENDEKNCLKVAFHLSKIFIIYCHVFYN